MGSKLSDHGYNTKLKMLPGGYLKPNLKKTIGYITIFLILGLILLPLLAQEVVHEYKIPFVMVKMKINGLTASIISFYQLEKMGSS